MAWEVPSTEVALPSPDLLQSAYESVRPHLKPEDVPAALTRDIGPGVCVSSAEGLPRLPSCNAISEPCTASYSPCSKMDECSTLTSDACGVGGHGQDPGLAVQQAPRETGGKSPEQQKGGVLQRRKQSRLGGGGGLRKTGVDIEHRHERVIQHRDRSTTYTLGGPRCSRTDGKHWQCKREALPDQKYCEKHLHRGLLRSRKRKREDNFQDLEGERLFQGWQRAKPKPQLWPWLCQPPPEVDQSPAASQSGLPSQALFPISSLQVPLPADSPWLAAGPQAALRQWTPAQEQILKATLSELGLDEKNARLGSSSAIAELRAQSLQFEGSPWAELPYNPTGHPRPLHTLPRTPNVLRVGQDQAVLPPSAQCAPERDGSFTVAIPLATLASVGVGVNAGGLISTWGCAVPICLILGGTAEAVKLEALRKDGDTVFFKGRPRASFELANREGEGRTLTPANLGGPGLGSAAPGKRGAVIPWDGEAFAEEPARENAAKGLNLDLNLHAAAMETGGTAGPQSEAPLWKVPAPLVHEKPPLSPLKGGSSPGWAPQESWGHFLQRLDARPEVRPANDLGADSGPGLLHRLRWESGEQDRSRGAPPVPANVGGAGLRRTVSLKMEKPDRGFLLQRIASLPVGFDYAPSPPKPSQKLLSKLKKGPGAGAEGTIALGGLNLGAVGDVLAGNVASVILQTPQGVFLGGGGKLDEIEKEDSCDTKLANRDKPRALSDGQGSQSGTGGDSMDDALSPPKSRKRAREEVLQGSTVCNFYWRPMRGPGCFHSPAATWRSRLPCGKEGEREHCLRPRVAVSLLPRISSDPSRAARGPGGRCGGRWGGIVECCKSEETSWRAIIY
ncbi:Putative WRC domain-containing protein [Klebsormidium nitens]|uniref:Putative WRC domain-containing protein n=1 Tax=Klebsormidium nitens TaxID=105231 RepID=A0A1Y1HMQ0_KLENI|nr:Putative WRC domain-containing protein [Klebsormidium nitens]|eukprot:GAQ79283.1 Putative WRC domain-containing protein [Klebsormidium nitens]